MKRRVNHLITSGIVAALVLTPLAAIGTASADPLGTITRYSTPTANAQPYDMVLGTDNNLWFTENAKAKIGRSTDTGSMVEYNLPIGYTEPTHMVKGPNDNIWFVARGGPNFYSLGEATTDGAIVMHHLPHAVDWNGQTASSSRPLSLESGGGYLWLIWPYSRYVAKISVDGQVVEQIEVSTPRGHDGKLEAGYITDARSRQSYNTRQIVYDTYAADGLWVVVTGGLVAPKDVFIEKLFLDGSRERIQMAPDAIHTSYSGEIAIDAEGTFWFGSVCCNYSLKYMLRSGQEGYINIGSDATNFARTLTVGPDGAIWGGTDATTDKIIRVDAETHELTEWNISGSGTIRPHDIVVGPDLNIWFTEYSTSKISRIGTELLPGDDADGDGLNLSNEFAQQTLDSDIDTDDDGISDYVESIQFAGRGATFCNQVTSYCEYPHPLHKDLYVEVDWMVKPAGSSAGYSMQPDATMVGSMKNAFSAKDIDLHVDTGQLGGGNEVEYAASIQYAPEHGARDLFDYKDGRDGVSQSFASNRRDIWRYMFMGREYAENAGSTGAALAGADEVFISYGLLKETPDPPFASLTTAIAGTMIHELGHSLCLEPGTQSYPQQSSACLFDGVDSISASDDYVSSMNYLYQMELVDYSDGENGANDHNDWAALGFDDFIYRDVIDEFGISGGITIEEARKAKRTRDANGIKVYQENGKYKVKQTLPNGKVQQLR